MPLVPRRKVGGDMDQFFDRFFEDFPAPEMPVVPRMLRPGMDVYETDENVVAEVEVPGVDPDNFNVGIEDNVLTVEGGQEQEQTDEDEDRGYFRKEIRRGHFKRSAMLPAEVKAEETEAKYKDGVLTVTMPKVQPKQSERKQIEVKAEE